MMGESLKRLQRWTGEREKQTSVAVPATFLPFAAPPIPASPRLGGLNNCSWWGGKCSLCSFSVPLGVLPTLTTLVISCCLTLSHTHRNTNTCMNTQALCSMWTFLTLCSLSSSYVGLFVAAVPELLEKNRKNKEQGKKDGEKRTEVVVEEVEKGGDEWERKETNVHIASRVSPVVARRPMFCVCVQQPDLEVVPSCA